MNFQNEVKNHEDDFDLQKKVLDLQNYQQASYHPHQFFAAELRPNIAAGQRRLKRSKLQLLMMDEDTEDVEIDRKWSW